MVMAYDPGIETRNYCVKPANLAINLTISSNIISPLSGLLRTFRFWEAFAKALPDTYSMEPNRNADRQHARVAH
jgi:hypothetical protein